MAYTIALLDNVALQKRLYFFDANFWIKILRPRHDLSNRDKKYLTFFEKFMKHPEQPRIAITALVLAEVINRLMREVAMHKYIREYKIPKEQVTPGFYKETYRKTDHFKGQYALLCDDIKGYHQRYEFLADCFGDPIRTKHILTRPSYSLDFNDNYYVLLAQHYKLPIITDDIDFFVEDVEVLTFNPNLYQKAKDAIVVKPASGNPPPATA